MARKQQSFEQRAIELKIALANGARFAKCDREYIEAAYEQLEKGRHLSMDQLRVVSAITQLPAATDDSK